MSVKIIRSGSHTEVGIDVTGGYIRRSNDGEEATVRIWLKSSVEFDLMIADLIAARNAVFIYPAVQLVDDLHPI